MAFSRQKGRFKEWLSNLFPPNDKIHYRPDGHDHLRAGPGEFFNHAQDFTLLNPVMTSVHNTVTYVQAGDRNLVTPVMSLLSQYIIRGAAHDDSARDPPPRCHPDTRVRLITRITAWFDGQARQELLLWITGPAGVGKSAIVQTCAEYLVKCNLLGASVFISRPNRRSNPHRIFVTIAYQLAIRIEEYRTFITERLSLDPELPNRGMAAQFSAFIVEPFVEKKIVTGGKRWCILFDGLDELEGEDAQCDVIQLISNFTREQQDSPLLWMIASRPEPHISNAFDDEEVRRSCWSEYIPIDSTEACQDVERFLRSSFKSTQKKFRQSVPSTWPSHTEFLKLTAAASGLFIYATVVMQFIRDPEYADPVSQLEVLLSIIDRSNAIPTKDNPFVHLDALYHEILSLIPLRLWPSAKQLLGFVIHWPEFRYILHGFNTLQGMSILFNRTPQAIHACLIKCHSVIKVPDWKVAHKENLVFLHASLADYLKDSTRSREFYVGDIEDAEDGVVLSLFDIWKKCNEDDIAVASVESTWNQYYSKHEGKTPPKALAKFYAKLFPDVVSSLRSTIFFNIAKPVESPIYTQLSKIHMIKLCYYFTAGDLWYFVWRLQDLATEANDARLIRNVQLKSLTFGHLDWKEMSPAHAHHGRSGRSSKEEWLLHRPRSSTELRTLVAELESVQGRSPEVEVIIFGGVPEGRIATFRFPWKENPYWHYDYMYYIVPYPEYFYLDL